MSAPPVRLQQLHTSSRVTTRLHRCEVSAIRLGCGPSGWEALTGRQLHLCLQFSRQGIRMPVAFLVDD